MGIRTGSRVDSIINLITSTHFPILPTASLLQTSQHTTSSLLSHPPTTVPVMVQPKIPTSLLHPEKQTSKSLRGFYEYLHDNATKDEATAVRFSMKHHLLKEAVSCKFCKKQMKPVSHLNPTSVRCPGSCKRKRSLTLGSLFATSPLHISTVLKIIGFWCMGFNAALTTKLVNVETKLVRYWYSLILEVCRIKLLQHGVPCSTYTSPEVEVTWRHIFGTCLTEQLSQTHWVRLVTHIADVKPPRSAI